jgi:hypothetical protein
MTYASNREPRRRWRTEAQRGREPCVSCGARARLHSAELPFCAACRDWTRQETLDEWDELGTGD